MGLFECIALYSTVRFGDMTRYPLQTRHRGDGAGGDCAGGGAKTAAGRARDEKQRLRELAPHSHAQTLRDEDAAGCHEGPGLGREWRMMGLVA